MNLGGSVKINKCGLFIVFLILVLIVYYTMIHEPPGGRLDASGLSVNPNEIQMRHLLIAAIQAAQMGGAEVLDVATKLEMTERSKGKTKEGANDPVTNADVRSHCVMQHGLHRIFPRLKIISEEDGTEKETHNRCKATEGRPAFDLDPTVLHLDVTIDDVAQINDVTVWIDPLDATQEYTENLLEYVTTMVCVAVNGKPEIGVIYNPFTKKTSWGWNAYKLLSEDLTPDAVAKKSDGDEPSVIVSRSHVGTAADTVRSALGERAFIVSAGGAGYKVLQLAAHNFDAYIHTSTIKKWDICAGNAILNAMGGQMTGLAGEEIKYDADSPVSNHFGVLAAFDHKHFLDKMLSKNAASG